MAEPLDRSRWVPVSPERIVVDQRMPDGTVRGFVGRLRVERSPTGAVRRATQLLPPSRPDTRVVPMPSRLGGGYLFVTHGAGTEIHRAATYLGTVTRIASSTASTLHPIPGIDSLLLRTEREGRLRAVDPETGADRPLTGLPELPQVGAVAFADATRGLVFSDIVGGLLTLDGGASWTRVAIDDASRGIALDGQDFVVTGLGGRFRVATDGSVTEEPDERFAPRRRDVASGTTNLERLVLHGWPVGDGSALLVDERGLLRLRLADGELLETHVTDAGRDGTCTALRLFADVGFACGGADATTLYQLDPPLGLRKVMTLPRGVAVAPQPNGAVVVDATCEGRRAAGAHCVLFPSGVRRELAARGDVGRERVVALSGDRVAMIVPPEGETAGRLTLVDAKGRVTVKPLDATGAALARTGTWLGGFYESGPDLLQGFVESPRALVGVGIDLASGTVAVASSPRAEPLFAVSGKTAVVLDPSRGLMVETLDGGVHWTRVELPEVGADGVPPSTTLRCGALGCLVDLASGTWARVGYGPRADADDLREPDARDTLDHPTPRRPLPTLRCSVTPPPKPRKAHDDRETRARTVASPLPDFRGVAAPAVPKGWGAAFDRAIGAGPAILYGIAPKGAATERGGRLVARFSRRFDPDQAVRSSAPTIAPFRDEAELGDWFGLVGPGVVVHAMFDPPARAATLSLCRTSREDCDLFLARDGQPLRPLKVTDGDVNPRPIPPSASFVLSGDTVVVGSSLPTQFVVRAFDGRESRVAMVAPRTSTHPFLPTMVARRLGESAGVLLRGQGTGATEDLFVVPLSDPDRRPVRLIPASLSGVALRDCGPSDDGWVVELPSQGIPVLADTGRLVDVSLLLRVEPGRACLDGVSGRFVPGAAPPRSDAAAPRGAPLAAEVSETIRTRGACTFTP